MLYTFLIKGHYMHVSWKPSKLFDTCSYTDNVLQICRYILQKRRNFGHVFCGIFVIMSKESPSKLVKHFLITE